MENQRVRLTKKLLNESLLYWLQQKPIERITVKEICERAELNRSTFYLHYADQYELLSSLEQQVIQQTLTSFQTVGADASTKQYIIAFLMYIRQNDTLYRTMLCQPNRESFRKRFVDESLGYLKEGIGLKADADIEPYILTYLLRGSLAMIQQWIESGYTLSEETLATLIYNMSDSVVKGYDNH